MNIQTYVDTAALRICREIHTRSQGVLAGTGIHLRIQTAVLGSAEEVAALYIQTDIIDHFGFLHPYFRERIADSQLVEAQERTILHMLICYNIVRHDRAMHISALIGIRLINLVRKLGISVAEHQCARRIYVRHVLTLIGIERIAVVEGHITNQVTHLGLLRHGGILHLGEVQDLIAKGECEVSSQIHLTPFIATDIEVDVEIASEFRYKANFFVLFTLIIPISQSGETADTLEALKLTKSKNCDSLGIINVKESSIARICDNVIYTLAGPEIAVATTKAYIAQVLVLSLIAIYLGRKTNKLTKEDEENLINELKSLPININSIINKDLYKKIANDIYNEEDIFFIGRNVDYALCMEGSLKLKEISYIHSEAYAAGELKHGTISLIDNNTPVFAVVTKDSIKEKTISNIKEVKARGAKVILVTNDTNIDKEIYDILIEIPKTNDLIQNMLTIVPLQVLSYEIAKLRGCDIDKPKNLAKSVTVE